MPIKGLTDNMAAFPRVGKIRKGAPKQANRPGADLNEFFRLDSDDLAVVAKFTAEYGEQPTEIDVLLPFVSPDENFTAWMEHWVAGGLMHRCDGVRCVVLRNSGGEYDRWALDDPNAPPCPGDCKPVGRLAVVLPKLERLVSLTVETHSKNDIANLDANLQAYYALHGSLSGIAFKLYRVKRKISTPGADGKRVSRDKWLLQLEPAPDWVAAKMISMQRRAMPQLSDSLRQMDPNELLLGLPPADEPTNGNGHDWPDDDSPEWSAGEDDDLTVDAETGEILAEIEKPTPTEWMHFHDALDWSVRVGCFDDRNAAQSAYMEIKRENKGKYNTAAEMFQLFVDACLPMVGEAVPA